MQISKRSSAYNLMQNQSTQNNAQPTIKKEQLEKSSQREICGQAEERVQSSISKEIDQQQVIDNKNQDYNGEVQLKVESQLFCEPVNEQMDFLQANVFQRAQVTEKLQTVGLNKRIKVCGLHQDFNQDQISASVELQVNFDSSNKFAQGDNQSQRMEGMQTVALKEEADDSYVFDEQFANDQLALKEEANDSQVFDKQFANDQLVLKKEADSQVFDKQFANDQLALKEEADDSQVFDEQFANDQLANEQQDSNISESSLQKKRVQKQAQKTSEKTPGKIPLKQEESDKSYQKDLIKVPIPPTQQYSLQIDDSPLLNIKISKEMLETFESCRVKLVQQFQELNPRYSNAQKAYYLCMSCLLDCHYKGSGKQDERMQLNLLLITIRADMPLYGSSTMANRCHFCKCQGSFGDLPNCKR